jgi:hypothetical protein
MPKYIHVYPKKVHFIKIGARLANIKGIYEEYNAIVFRRNL